MVVPGTVTASSDRKLKTQIIPIENALEKVKKLRGVQFSYKSHGGKSIGLIAQELEKVFPELVHGDELKSIAYQNLVAVLIEAVKDLCKDVEQRENSYIRMMANLNEKINNFIDKYEKDNVEGEN